MTAPTIRSTTRILRPNTIGKCIEAGVYVPYESLRFLKVGTYHTGASTSYGVSILGIFNLNEQALTELIPLRDFDGVNPEREYIIRAHPSGNISPPMSLDSEFPVVELALDTKGWNILTAYPLYSVPNNAEERTDVAVLGLVGKMTGAAAVVGTPGFERRNIGGLKMGVVVKALGVLGMVFLVFPVSCIPANPYHYPHLFLLRLYACHTDSGENRNLHLHPSALFRLTRTYHGPDPQPTCTSAYG